MSFLPGGTHELDVYYERHAGVSSYRPLVPIRLKMFP